MFSEQPKLIGGKRSRVGIKQITVVTDYDTGEITESEKKWEKNNGSYKIDRNNRFFYKEKTMTPRMWMDRFLKNVGQKLSMEEKGRILTLLDNLGEDNVLQKRGGVGYIPLTRNDIAKILGLKERATREFLNKLIELNIIRYIKYCDRKAYIVNPIYFMYGRRLTECMSCVYKEDIESTLKGYEEQEDFRKHFVAIRNKPEIIR